MESIRSFVVTGGPGSGKSTLIEALAGAGAGYAVSREAGREQTFDEAARTYEAMRRVYPEYGYELAELPYAPVHERVRFVLAGL